MWKSLVFVALFIASVNAFAVDLDNEETIDSEKRGLLSNGAQDQIRRCLGQVSNKFLTKITSTQGFTGCIKQVCVSGGFDDNVINSVAQCVGLQEGLGPGPGPDGKWNDFGNKQKMMIMSNRGRLGFCLRQEGRQC